MLAALAPYRLGPQRLVGEPLPDAVAAVRHLGAVQSQDHLTAEWSVGRRCGADARTVRAAFDAGAFVRTHVLRPTWHHVHVDDLRHLVAVSGERVMVQLEGHSRRLGIDASTLRRGADAVADHVRRHDACTRDELAAALERGGLPGGPAAAHLVMAAELQGHVASGPMRGRRHTYRALDLPASDLSADEQLAWLARTYARGHGPFTPADLAWWSSVTLEQARAAVRLAGLTEVELAGRTLFTDRPPQRVDVPRALLLANFDEVISHVREPAVVAEAGPQWPTMMRSLGLLLVDGRLGGRWSRTVRARDVTVDVVAHDPLDDEVRTAVAAEADRLGDFLGLPARVTITTT